MTTAAKIPSRESAAQRLHVVGTGFDVEKIRRDFPILSREIRGKKLVYLDNAATAQKPRAVIEAISRYYEQGNANVHRGVHFLSEYATGEHERARRRVQRFINAPRASEIIFVRGATEAINLVAQTYGRVHVRAGDEVLITAMEHHSNIVPWQILCEEKGAKLQVVLINDDGELLLDEFEKLLGPRTKIVAVSHVSNALGTVNPIGRIVEMAHRNNIPVLLDGAQAVPHMKVNVQALDCDLYGARARGRALFRNRRHPPARCRDGSRPGGYCDQDGPSLRATRYAALRRPCDCACFLCALQHQR